MGGSHGAPWQSQVVLLPLRSSPSPALLGPRFAAPPNKEALCCGGRRARVNETLADPVGGAHRPLCLTSAMNLVPRAQDGVADTLRQPQDALGCQLGAPGAQTLALLSPKERAWSCFFSLSQDRQSAGSWGPRAGLSPALQGLRTPAVPRGAPRKAKSRHREEAGTGMGRRARSGERGCEEEPRGGASPGPELDSPSLRRPRGPGCEPPADSSVSGERGRQLQAAQLCSSFAPSSVPPLLRASGRGFL